MGVLAAPLAEDTPPGLRPLAERADTNLPTIASEFSRVNKRKRYFAIR
jgi:hypothetical protein